MPRIPSPECPIKKDHDEHMFRIFGQISLMTGAHVDCPGKG
jgi:hypothetical protein